MEKPILSSEVFIDESSNGKLFEGYMTIHSTETINIDGIKGQVYFEMRGMLSSEKKQLASFIITNKKRVHDILVESHKKGRHL